MTNKNFESAPRLVKPSQLPIYDKPIDVSSNAFVATAPLLKPAPEWFIKFSRPLQVFGHRVSDSYHHYIGSPAKKTFDSFSGASSRLTGTKAEFLMKPGFIAVGGLAGAFVFGRKGGSIKKIFYGSIGAGTVASVCYPKQSWHVAQTGWIHSTQLWYDLDLVNKVKEQLKDRSSQKVLKTTDSDEKMTEKIYLPPSLLATTDTDD